jgi:hypothetical protein
LAPKPLRNIPEASLFTRLDALAASADPKLRRLFLLAIRGLLSESDKRALTVALTYGDPDMAETAVPWIKLEINLAAMFQSPPIRTLAAGAGDAAAWMAGTERRTDAVLERLDQSAQLRAAQITDETRRGIRAFVSEAHTAGRPIADVQRDVESALYAEGGFGLDERSARAVGRRLARMVEREGLTAKERANALRTLNRQALAARARRIVATELNAITNQAMQSQWEAEGSVTHKEWVARMNNKTCERCAAFDGVVVSINDPFVSRAPFLEVAFTPEIHPNGFCVMRPARKA